MKYVYKTSKLTFTIEAQDADSNTTMAISGDPESRSNFLKILKVARGIYGNGVSRISSLADLDHVLKTYYGSDLEAPEIPEKRRVTTRRIP